MLCTLVQADYCKVFLFNCVPKMLLFVWGFFFFNMNVFDGYIKFKKLGKGMT